MTLIGATTENPYFEVNSALLSSRAALRAAPARPPEHLTPAAATRARRSRARDRGPARRSRTRRWSCSRRARGGDARMALSALERAVETARRGRASGRPRHRRGRASAQGAHLRPRGRPPLRLHLRLDQGHPRLRPRRLPLLPGGDARGRRGPPLHRPPDGDPGLRGRRQRRPAGARGRQRRRRGGGPGGAARVPAEPRAGSRLPGAGPEVERLLPRHPAGHGARSRARREAAALLPAGRPLPGRSQARARESATSTLTTSPAASPISR